MLDPLFRRAVAALDAGDLAALERLLAEHPELATERLEEPGEWLREQIGAAVDGFFARPYLLWFVAEDPVRTGALPANVVELARAIVHAARAAGAPKLQEQLDYALRLVAWSGVAHRAGVQLALIDLLVDEGGNPDGVAQNALVNGHFAAAARAIARGGRLTLPVALCLERWDDVERLLPKSDARLRQFSLVLAALNGRAEAVRRLLAAGVDPNAHSQDLYAHASPLHHAVCSASLETVQALAEGGADPAAQDTVHGATPLGWADWYAASQPEGERAATYAAIAEYLRARSG